MESSRSFNLAKNITQEDATIGCHNATEIRGLFDRAKAYLTRNS
jgi:hypothetical protein